MLREPMILCLQMSAKENVETGFYIRTSKDGTRIIVDKIVKGSKNHICFGREPWKPKKQKSSVQSAEELAQIILETSRELCEADPYFVGDFHVHRKPNLPLNILDMYQTLSRRGYLTILGNLLNRKRAKITYYLWSQDDAVVNKWLVRAGTMAVLLLTDGLSSSEARKVERWSVNMGEALLKSKMVRFKESFSIRFR